MAGDTTLGTAQIPIRATLDQLDKDLAGVRGKIEGSLKGVQDLGKVALGGLAAGALVAAGAIATIGPAAINAASDLNESVSKANVVFGDAIKEIDTFAASSASSFGIAKQAAYEATGTFGNLFTTIGLAKGPAADMSVDIVKLAADLASFNNLPTDVVLEKLRSGLVGEVEPLRSLGVQLSEAEVQQKALNMGLANTPKALTPAMKLQARYALIMEKTKTAQGDFARTSDGLANTQRILGATFKDISADVGTAFLPMILGIAKAVQPIVKSLMPGLQSTLAKIAPIAQIVGDSLGGFVASLLAGTDPLTAFRTLLSNLLPPEMVTTIMGIVAGVQSFLASIQPTIDQVMAWLAQNVSLQDVLIALGIAIAAVVIPAILSVVATVAPIIAAFVALVAVAALLRQAWDTDWNGIRTTLTAFWEGTAKPALEQLWAWLQVNVPAAIQTLANFWTTVLQPALLTVWTWIQTVLFPMLADLWTWLATNVPAAIQTLADFWNNVLRPALNAVWSFIQTSIMPLLSALVTLGLAIVSKAVEALAGLWQNVLLPALTAVWKWIDQNIMPVLNFLWKLIEDKVWPKVKALAEICYTLAEHAQGVAGAFDSIVGAVKAAASAIANFKLPSWLTPGSPTPLELGLRGIRGEMSALARMQVPQLGVSMAALSGPSDTGSHQTVVNIYGLTLNGVQNRAGLLAELQAYT